MGGILISESQFFIRGNIPVTKPHGDYYLGLDCGQAQDFTALSILEHDGQRYIVKHLERLPLDTAYPQVIERCFRLMHRKPLDSANRVLAIDYTGVGRPVWDLACDRGLNPIGISITGGDSVSWQDDHKRARVPKRDLIAGLQIAAQNDCLKVAQGLKFGPILAEELQSFKVKIDPRTAHDSYGAWREGEHDDLILSAAVALWTAQNLNAQIKPIIRYISRGGRGRVC